MRNIYKMMAQGNQSADKVRQASPFLNYAIDRYNVNLDDLQSLKERDDEGFEESSQPTSV